MTPFGSPAVSNAFWETRGFPRTPFGVVGFIGKDISECSVILSSVPSPLPRRAAVGNQPNLGRSAFWVQRSAIITHPGPIHPKDTPGRTPTLLG